MSALLLDSRPHSAAVRAAIATVLDSNVYDFGKVPGFKGNTGTQPDRFAVVSLDFIPSVNQRMSAQTGTTRWRVSVRGVGRTVAEAAWVLAQVASALHEHALTVESRSTTPLQAEPGQAPRPDEDARYSGLAVYTYAH